MDGPRDIRLEDVDPAFADRVRDAAALVRCWDGRDEAGARAIFTALADEGGPALEAVTRAMAAMLGMTLRAVGIRPGDVDWLRYEDEG
jgi:hypothetical protein